MATFQINTDCNTDPVCSDPRTCPNDLNLSLGVGGSVTANFNGGGCDASTNPSSITYDCDDIGTFTEQVIVTDDNGTSTCDVQVTISDPSGNCGGGCSGDVTLSYNESTMVATISCEECCEGSTMQVTFTTTYTEDDTGETEVVTDTLSVSCTNGIGQVTLVGNTIPGTTSVTTAALTTNGCA